MQKILLVDDERRMLDLLSLYLTPHQYSCTKAQGAQEALRYLDSQAFDLVLLDIMMPDMSGFELCAKIRDFSDVPIIMLTAREQQEDIVKGLKLGADDYITKPFEVDQLLARVRRVFESIGPDRAGHAPDHGQPAEREPDEEAVHDPAVLDHEGLDRSSEGDDGGQRGETDDAGAGDRGQRSSSNNCKSFH